MLANARDLVDFVGPARSFTNCRIGMARRRRDPGPARQPQGGEEARAGAWVEDRPEESSHASETCALVKSPQMRGVIATQPSAALPQDSYIYPVTCVPWPREASNLARWPWQPPRSDPGVALSGCCCAHPSGPRRDVLQREARTRVLGGPAAGEVTVPCDATITGDTRNGSSCT
jgi:hypothetical protein